MKLILVRHGESEANIAHVINDDPIRVVPLTERGVRQAAMTAELLREVPFTHAYTSEFTRAQETARILLRDHGLEVMYLDERLNERRSGMDGQHVEVFNDYVRADPLGIKPPKGESFLEQMERLREFMDEIAGRHPDGVVLAVSHENPILAAQALTMDDPEEIIHFHLTNCAVVELSWPPV